MKSSTNSKLDSFDHVVVLMLENRSFDNLLGFLYTPEELLKLNQDGKLPLGKTFNGLLFNGPHCNPIPKDAPRPDGVGDEICVSRATDFHQPFPDPGEDYPHVNTQLFGTINPASNLGASDDKIVFPYNRPTDKKKPPYDLPDPAPMDGFIKDYFSVLKSIKPKSGCLQFFYNLIGRNPLHFKPNDAYNAYKVIMEAYQPDQVNVTATLAKQFAVFDNWHCAVPSQTYTNRSFWHAGTASGHVNNSPMTHWIFGNDKETLFNRLGKDNWNIYTDNPISITGIVHFQKLLEYHLTHFKGFQSFLDDAQSGALPKYSFVEPRFFTPHNDQHPSSFDSLLFGASHVGSVQLGEILINDVYNAVRNSPKWDKTLLIITHDEHGGTYDHVSPPTGVMPPNGNPLDPAQNGFPFNRLGIRVPMIMVSAHIAPHTIVNSQMQHTSFLRTMSKKWDLGHFTERDANAPQFTEVFTNDEVRDVKDWPDISYPTIPQGFSNIDYSSAPLNHLQKVMVEAVGHFKKQNISNVRGLKTVGEAFDFLKQFDDLPGVKIDELTNIGKPR